MLNCYKLIRKQRALPADWDTFAACGAPLSRSYFKPIQPTAELLLNSLYAGCLELQRKPNNPRKVLTVQAVLLALATHYPTFFYKYCRNSPLLMKFYPKKQSGSVIKLKRQAVAVLSTYL